MNYINKQKQYVIPAKAGIQSWGFVIAIAIMTLSAPVFAQDLSNILGSALGGVGMLANAAKDITPSEEHYIGRSVAAMVINKYPLLNDPALTKYVNEVGILLSEVSDMPSTYDGYHFAVLNSDEPNAFACPGGIILINKGLIKQAANEDQLAAILAHEVAHVAGRHGINAIKKSRWTQFAFYAAGEVGKNYSSDEISQLTSAFQDVVKDVAKKVIDSGYSKADEAKADSNGLSYMYNAGYNPNEMVAFLMAEETAGIGHAKGPFSSHPKPADRIKAAEGKIKGMGARETAAVRTARFKAAAK